MSMNGQKNLSCKRCQIRKIRCNRRQPCSNCSQIDTPCEYRRFDVRRRPVSQTHVAALESQLARYESLFHTLKSSTSNDRDTILKELDLNKPSSVLPTSLAIGQASDDDAVPREHFNQAVALLSGPSGTLQYHGPTSIYLDQKLRGPSPPLQQSSNIGQEPWSCIRLALTLGIDDNLLRTCLQLFFIQEYSHSMFIYREAFLEDYYTNTYNGRYWSYPLLHAVCALGAMRSDDIEIRSKAPVLATCAQEAIFASHLSSPNITTVQALLCIAFHELGQGSSSLGWLFSGMAIHIAQELGLHQDPHIWINSDRNISTTIDIEIRRRVYWGCFVADKYISLFLGRPIHLAENDAAVRMSEPLPDFPDDHDWFGLGAIASDESHDVQSEKPRLTLALKYAVSLGEIFQDIMTNIFSPRSAHKAEAATLSALGQLNLRLNRWLADLPKQLQWSQWVRKAPGLRRSVLELHLFYHSVVISLNRHFLSPSQHFPLHHASSEICAASSDEVLAMLRHFRNDYGSINTSLMMIYAVVLIAIILVTDSARSRPLPREDSRITFCMRTLQEASTRYKLAGEAHARLLARLNANTGSPGPESSKIDTELPPPVSQDGTNDVFFNLFGAGDDANSAAFTLDAYLADATTIPTTSAAASAPEAGNLSQSDLDMFSMHMQDESATSVHGDFYGWFSDAFT